MLGPSGLSRSLTTNRQVLAFIQTGRSALAIEPLHGAAQEATFDDLVAPDLGQRRLCFPATSGNAGWQHVGRHVLAKGHPVALLIRTKADEDRYADLLAHGEKPLTSAAEVAATAEVVIICVTGSPQVEDVVFGDNGILRALKPGCVAMD